MPLLDHVGLATHSIGLCRTQNCLKKHPKIGFRSSEVTLKLLLDAPQASGKLEWAPGLAQPESGLRASPDTTKSIGWVVVWSTLGTATIEEDCQHHGNLSVPEASG